MNPNSLTKITIALTGIILSIASVEGQVFFNGSNLVSPFGGGGSSATLDNTTWSPNSSVQQSLRMEYTSTFQTRAFRGTTSDQHIASSSVDWSQMELQIDYRTSNVTALYRIRVLAGSDVVIGDSLTDAPLSIPLVADDNWNTLVVPISSWTAAYTTAQPGFNPDTVSAMTLNIQNHNPLGTVYFDNARFVVVPEPSTVALLTGLAILGGVLLLRRKNI